MLTLLPDQTLRLDHDEVAYAPIPSDAALGALLFALGVSDVDLAQARPADRPALGLALAAARQFVRILERHAGRADRGQPLLPAGAGVERARAWVAGAALAVPAAERERFCWRMARRLGDDPWCDGSPAIVLPNLQFGLFASAFEELEPPPAAGPSPA